MIEIPLSEIDWGMARRVGARRMLEGRGSLGWGHRTVDQEAIGVAGELAFGKYIGRSAEFVYGRGDNGDFRLGDSRVDVKTSQLKSYQRPERLHLLAHKVSKPSDIYVRVFIAPSREKAWLYGWTTREELVKAPTMVWENHELYAMPSEQLYGMDELKKLFIIP